MRVPTMLEPMLKPLLEPDLGLLDLLDAEVLGVEAYGDNMLAAFQQAQAAAQVSPEDRAPQHQGSWSLVPSVNVPALVEAPSLDAVRAGRGSIKRGMRGDAVTHVQRALSLYGVTPDGVFGSDTEGAVRRFQGDYGLSPVDGIVGRKTLAVFDDPSARPAPEKPGLLDKVTSLFTSSDSAPAPVPAPGSNAAVAEQVAATTRRNQIIAGALGLLAAVGIGVAVTR